MTKPVACLNKEDSSTVRGSAGCCCVENFSFPDNFINLKTGIVGEKLLDLPLIVLCFPTLP